MKKYAFVLCFVLLLLLNFLQATFTPLVDDEAYYWVWSKHLAFGYYDHPPMIAWMIRLGNFVTTQEIGLRFISTILFTFNFFLFYAILQPKSTLQRWKVLCLFASTPFLQLFGFISTPDTVLLFFTLLYLYYLKQFLDQKKSLAFLGLSFAIAGLFYSKYHGFLVVAFTLLPHFLFLLNSKKFYLTIFIAFLLYIPHIFWLIEHDFVPFRYHLAERNQTKIHFDAIAYLLIGGLFLGTLAYSPFLWKTFFSIKNIKRRYRFDQSILYLSLMPMVFFLVMSLKNKPQLQWLLIGFVAQLIWLYLTEDLDNKLFFRLGFANLIVLIVARILLLSPSLSWLYDNRDAALRIGNEVKDSLVIFEKYQEASLFAFYANRSTWVYRTLDNRRSSFDDWQQLNDFDGKDFVFVSRWQKSNQSVIGWRDKPYFITKVENFKPEENYAFHLMSSVNYPAENTVVIELSSVSPAIFSSKNFQDLPLLYLVFIGDPHHSVVYLEDIREVLWEGKIKHQKTIQVSVRSNLLGKSKKVYVGLQPRGLPMYSVSNKISIESDKF
ncbi:glycosyltransferase family 39 protein [Weeksella virosa]|uniref:ArnT family glycosyltransferase n=1 Tax=Weeksella virosa TaxID=1014 RepID=UPI002556FBA8|nr:glycosyltransferase family 39 protein [Weeksella virosa]MDK7374383.1 glycosyltransferase family 39 protein [Weeksella virosa]